MVTALASDLRVRVMVDVGMSAEKATAKYPVSARTIDHWKATGRWGDRAKKVLRAAEQQRPDVVEKHRWRDRLMMRHPVSITYFSTKWRPTRRWLVVRRGAEVRTPGDIVVMDNLSSHHRADIREVLEAAGYTLAYLPSYNPDLNPIEQLFAKLKALLPKHSADRLPRRQHRIRLPQLPNNLLRRMTLPAFTATAASDHRVLLRRFAATWTLITPGSVFGEQANVTACQIAASLTLTSVSQAPTTSLPP